MKQNTQKKNSRRNERSLAFQVLYAISFSEVKNMDDVRRAFCQSPDNIKEQGENDSKDLAQDHAHGFAWDLVSGVWANSKDLDEVIVKFSHNWRVDRMGRIELTVLRIGLFEMLYRTDIPTKVAINEALELSRQFGEQSARSFVNGILDAAAKAFESGNLQAKA